MPADKAGNSERMLPLLAVVLAAVMFVFPLAISFPLLDPDEGLHASIAQEMVERGDWSTPQFLGQPFLDKPVFYFWMQAASLRLFGPSEWAVRLPGLMFGLLGAATTGMLGWRLLGRTTGWIAGILYATTILPTALAQAASHDVALIPWINLAVLLLWESERAVARRAVVACLAGAGLFLGLALLTKGLFGVAVVGLAFGGYVVAMRRVNLAILLHGAAVLAVAVLVASPWYAWLEMRSPGYLRYFFLERHLLGFATDSQPHGDGPWWYYLPVLLGGGLPWIGYLPVVVQDGLARRRLGVASQSPMPLLWIWLLGWTLLMLLAGSKLATYLLPAFPPLAILAATAWTGLIDGTLDAAARRSFARTFVWSSWSGPILLPAAVLAVQVAFGVAFGWSVWAAAGGAAVVAALPLIPWRAGRP
jgi:4-amino-4-deoxy-L-arabinose transferase-like glycosyltransferase